MCQKPTDFQDRIRKKTRLVVVFFPSPFFLFSSHCFVRYKGNWDFCDISSIRNCNSFQADTLLQHLVQNLLQSIAIYKLILIAIEETVSLIVFIANRKLPVGVLRALNFIQLRVLLYAQPLTGQKHVHVDIQGTKHAQDSTAGIDKWLKKHGVSKLSFRLYQTSLKFILLLAVTGKTEQF